MCAGNGRIYRIEVNGELSERYNAAFEEMLLQTGRGHTVISGRVHDQSHLHGILVRINAMGLELISVESEPDGPPKTGDQPGTGTRNP